MLTNSKSEQNLKSSSTATMATTTPTKSPVKQLPGKIAKQVKHQFRRLDDALHHMVHPHHRNRTSSFSVTSSSSPIFYPINVARAFLPPDQSSVTGSVHSRDETWDVKYHKDVDSLDESPADHSIDLSISLPNSSATHVDVPDEQHLPQEEPQLKLHKQDISAIDPNTASPIETDNKHHLPQESVHERDTSASDRAVPTLIEPETSDNHPLPQEPLHEQDASPSDSTVPTLIEPEISDKHPPPQESLHEQDTSASDPTPSPIEPETSDISDKHHLPQDEPLHEQDASAPDPTVPTLIEPETLDTSDKQPLPQEEPQLNLHEQDASDSNPTPNPIEPETPDMSDGHHLPQEEPLHKEHNSASDPSPVETETPDMSDEHHLQQEPLHKQDISVSNPMVASPIEPETPDISDEHQVEPQLQLHEQDISVSDPAVSSPNEPESPDPVLVGDEKDPLSEEEPVTSHIKLEAPDPILDDEEKQNLLSEEADKKPSDANPSQDVSPSQAVPFDLSSPDANIPQPQASLPNSHQNILPPSESAKHVPGSYVPALIVPTMFLPIRNVRRSLSSNLLTWWLPSLPLPPVSRSLELVRGILTSRRLLLLLLLLLIRDSTAPLAAAETLALFASF